MGKDTYQSSAAENGGEGQVVLRQSHDDNDFPTDAVNVEIMPPMEQDKKEMVEEKTKSIGFIQMFRYADKLDGLLLFIGAIATVCQGLAIPINYFVYGDLVTSFIYYSQLQSFNATGTENSTDYLPFDPADYEDLLVIAQEYAVYFVLIAVSAILSGFIQFACWGIAAERQIRRVRTEYFNAVIHQEISWFDTNDGAQLNSGFSESMHGLTVGLGVDTSVFLQWMCTCLGAYVIALVTGWKLALVCLAFSPVIIIIVGISIRWIKRVAMMEANAYAKAGSVVEEVLSSIKTVMAFNGQDKDSRRYTSMLDEASSSSLSKGLAMGLGMGFLWFVLHILIAVALYYGTKLTVQKEPGFEPGNILTIFLSVMIGSAALGQAFPILETITAGKAAATRIYSVIDQKPVIYCSSDNGARLESVEGRVELMGVSFKYPARPGVQVLHNMNITIDAGKTVALVGSSGCGKSTVVQLVERFYDPMEGQVLLDGHNIRDLNVAWLRQQIGLVSQEPVLFGTTIYENIQYGRIDVTDDEIHQAAIKANIHDFIKQLPEGYKTVVGDRGTQLSGGQKQRVAIARALVRNPRILLLDEATSALDNESEAVVQEALEKAKEGRTTIIVAHRLSTIRNADKIIAVRDGHLMEEGTHTELMHGGGLYRQLVEHQMQGNTVDAVVDEIDKKIKSGNKEVVDGTKAAARPSSITRTLSVTSAMSENAAEEAEKEAILQKFSMKRLLRLNASEWPLLLVAVLCSVIAGTTQPSLAVLITEFLKVFTKPDEEKEDFARTMVAITAGAAVFNCSIRIVQAVCFAKSGAALTRRLRELTFQAFLRQDMEFFDDPKHRVGILSTRLSSDTTLVEGATGTKNGQTLESLATVVSVLVIGFVSSWKLTLVVLGFMPLFVVLGLVQGKVTQGFSKSDKGSLANAGLICSETIENIRLVASLTREETLKEKYNKIVNGICSKGMQRSVATAVLLGLSASVMFFAYAAAFTFGAYLVQDDGLEFNLVVRVFATIVFGGMTIGRYNSIAPDFTKAKLAAARLFEFIDTAPKIDVTRKDGETLDKFSGCIEFRDVQFHYSCRPDASVLRGLTLTAEQGQTVALVGASGCGKSTTLALLERLYDPVAGSVCADGEDITSLNLKWLRSQIGYVTQEPILFDCSIAENIAYGDNTRHVPMDDVIAAARSANIHNFITSLPEGYETNVGNKGTQLSGGEKQRVAIARALVSNPKLLLLDEATSALDSHSEKIVQDALDRARHGRTCFIIAHRLSTVQAADMIAIVHQGRVAESGTHGELMARQGLYYKLIQVHNRKQAG